MTVATFYYTYLNKKMMRNCFYPFGKTIQLTCVVLAFFFSLQTQAQTLPSITTTGVAHTQNFDAIGASPTATLPSGFKFGPDWSTARTVVNRAYGTSGTGAITSTSGGGDCNFANGVLATATDRAIGFFNSGSWLTPDTIILKITNNTGAAISNLDISFDYEKYRSGTRAFNLTFFHGSTSVPSISETTGDQAYASDLGNTAVNPPTSISKTISLSGLSIPNGGDYYLRWTMTGVGGSTNGQAIGIDNISITASTLPTVINPTVSGITTSSAILGAEVTGIGSGTSLLERGTVFNTVAGVTATANALAEGGTTIGVFTQTRSLQPETRYFFKGYAKTALGSGLSPESSFFTLSNAPLTQPTSFSATPFSSTQIDLTWQPGDFPTSGATAKRYLLLSAVSPNVPVFTGTNGSAPTAGANTTIVGQNISSAAASATGLSIGETYNFLLIPYCWDGTNAETYNYLTSGAPTTTATTSSVSAPVLSNPTATSITNNTAVLGATIDSDGGQDIIQRGTVYSTTNPVNISNVVLDEGGTTTGTYSHLRNGLDPQTTYYYAGYAVNAGGAIALSPQASFVTLSNPPLSAVSSFTATPFSGSQINLSWTAAGFPTVGATQTKYMVLRALHPNVPGITNGNGSAPILDANTTLIGTLDAAATSFSSTGLTGNTRYQYAIIPYTWDGINNTTYHYFTTTIPSADATTFTAAPASQPFSLFFSNLTCNTVTLNWRNSSAGAAGYIVLQSTGLTAPNVNPSSGVVYTTGNTIGNASVVYVGTDTTLALSGLVDGTRHHYRIYAYNGSSSTDISYLTTFPLSRSVTTLNPSAPVANAASGIGLTGFTANWASTNCAPNGYKLDVSQFENFFDPAVSPVNLVGETFENSLNLFTLTGTGSAYRTGNSAGTEIPANSPFASQGSFGFGSAGGNSVLTSNNINTTGLTSTQVSFKLAAFNGMEATDRIFVEVSPDGGTTWYNTLTVTGFNGASWGYSATATAAANFDGDSTTASFSAQNGSYSTVQINNLPSVSQLRIRINMISDATTEWWVIDDFKVTGRNASYVASYADFSVSGTTQELTGLTNNTTYYYRVRAVGSFFPSVSSNTISATTLNGSPEISNPTVTGVTNNSAVLGAEVVSFGADATLTARGTAYGTTSGSVTASSNASAEGGLSLGTYTQNRTGLSPQT
ncbi:MAG: hypothetical protein RL092_1136, partial [Bacteroidota bacterium]